jgi:hypothetical protein
MSDVHPAFRAVEIAIVAIGKNRCETWDDLIASGKDTRLTDEQLELVLSEIAVVRQIQVKAGAAITITQCPICGRIAFVGTGTTVPTKCTLTAGCTGKPAKAGAAKRANPTAAEDVDDD